MFGEIVIRSEINTKSQQQTSTSYVESGNMQLSQAEVIVDDAVEISRVRLRILFCFYFVISLRLNMPTERWAL